ncbi:zinc finger FYVE domain-containing protein 16 isoform X1 [Sander lucioperca]|uniref:Zinc finger, FYVE domain containing 16 n=1 Tax=Sander lucioperca TaxID=283035 RepID=A0A8C9YG27_SANLU|nr:zinc finger FYVE domain-containing protein 16 isoform X1 [Sander lucioperca]XP_035847432.1 zinc finger FYVE domain-containing protein 16 isoform X1 [Sander lucioperca]XP_035847433.1 zinc finger FYVE domain-containing protein 16 isoform X1 [Sander lucioperca]
MDSFFKAAVCDLDKLLDDFELNTEELECKSVFLKPSVYPFSSPRLSSEASTVPPNLPDLNSLHYGSATSCPDPSGSPSPGADDREVKGQPLTGVDLLSSVDRRPAQSSAPPCPDRALKPVCDLVNDTSSAILVRANSHDAFSEMDVVEKQMEEEEEKEEKKEKKEMLLVDFDSPVITVRGEELGRPCQSSGCGAEKEEQASAGKDKLLGLDSHERSGEYSASLSLLDVILSAAVERSCEPADDSLPPSAAESVEKEERDGEEAVCTNQVLGNSLDHCEGATLPADSIKETTTTTSENREDEPQEASDQREAESPIGLKSGASECEPVGLSCLPIAVSMCGALVNTETIEDESGLAPEQCDEAADVSESTEADSLSAAEAREDRSYLEGRVDPSVSASQQVAEGRVSPEVQHLALEPAAPAPAVPAADLASCERSEPSPVDPPEFGFEYLPESDQAELLVTDEELDAFLQAHTEAEQGRGVSYCSGSRDFTQPESLSELNGDLEGTLVGEELRSCGRGRREDLEGLASPESDRTMCVSVEGSFNPGAPSQDSCRPPCQEEPELSSGVSHSLTSNTFQSQHSSSPDQPPSYGGARPKQLHCHIARSPPAGEDGEEQAQTLSTAENEEESSPTSLTEEHSNIRDLSPMYASQEHQDFSPGYDELSEPPPYPGDSPTDGARSVNWKREGAEELGSRQPSWVPDSEAPNCMNCYQRFTFTKRRHHCRACGKVYCAVCCNRKCKLKYLEKEARVCVVCFDTIHRAQALERMMSPAGPSPNPNVPSEYCSTIPPLQQARAAGTLNSPPPTVMVPVSVLKHPNNDSCPREHKRVWFADGILPNGEVADTSKLSVTSRRSSQEFSAVSPDQTTPGSEVGVGGCSAPEASVAAEVVRPPVSGPWDYALLSGIGTSVKRVPSLLPDNDDELPPLLITTGEEEAGDVLVEESPAPCQILHLLEEGGPRPLTFVLNANLLVNVKLVSYATRQCWCFGSNGLQALGQRELVFLLECLPEEKTLPKDLFTLYLNIYQEAQKGKFVEELDNVTFTSSFLGSKDHAGMLFFSPTCQPLDGLTLPPQPFMFGLLVQKLEVPWAKVFPLRLLLRLGAEYSVYPTTLTSVRFRDSVYRETGHTIMNLLADLRNYQYSLSIVEGLRIHMEMGHSYIDIPKCSFNEMQKVVNASNEHVISIGARFSSEADSHLVCFQNEEGNYQTQANSKPGKTRTVTGASFVVFNGALKASSGFIAKSSIVEDGLMVQIPPETMESLRTALREQTDFLIPCGRNDGSELRENVTVRWVDLSAPVNTGRASGVDGRPLDGVRSVRMQQDTEFESDGRTITCTEVFYQPKTPDCSLASVLSSCSVFQKEMALAACSALTPHLAVLTSSGINSLSLRISTQADMVEYQAGSGGRLLPQRYMNELDSALIPVIHGGSASVPQTAMDMEFIFYITHTI